MGSLIEPGTVSDGIRGKLSLVGALWVPEVCQKDVTGHIIMADGSYRTV
jgi:hypothetical protein